MPLYIVIPKPFFPSGFFSSNRYLTNKHIYLLSSAGVWVAMKHTAGLGITRVYFAFCIIHKNYWAQMNKEVWVPCHSVLTIMQKTHTSQVKWSLAQTATDPPPLPKYPYFTHTWLIFEEHCLLLEILSFSSNIIPVSKRHLLNPVMM